MIYEVKSWGDPGEYSHNTKKQQQKSVESTSMGVALADTQAFKKKLP